MKLYLQDYNKEEIFGKWQRILLDTDNNTLTASSCWGIPVSPMSVLSHMILQAVCYSG